MIFSTLIRLGMCRPHSLHSCTGRFCFIFSFLFYTGVQPIDNVVMASGGQQRDSDVRIHVAILPQTPLPPRLPHNIKQSSLCCTVGLSLSILLSDFIYSLLSLCPLNEFPQNPVPLISGPTAIISFSQSPCLMQEVAPFLRGRGVVDGGAKWRRGGRGP